MDVSIVLISAILVVVGFMIGRTTRMMGGQFLPIHEIRIVFLIGVLVVVSFFNIIDGLLAYIGCLFLGICIAYVCYWSWQNICVECPNETLSAVVTIPISYYWFEGQLYEHHQGLRGSIADLFGIRSRLDFDGYDPSDHTKDDAIGIRHRHNEVSNGLYWITVQSVVASSMTFTYTTTNFGRIGTRKETNKVTGEVKRTPRYIFSDLPVSERHITWAQSVVEDQLTYLTQTGVWQTAIKTVSSMRSETLQLRAELDSQVGKRASYIVKSLFDTGLDCTEETDALVQQYLDEEKARRGSDDHTDNS